MIHWIPLKTWMAWSPEERGQVAQHYESIGWKWAIDLSDKDESGEAQKDYEEEAYAQGVKIRDLIKR